MGEKEQGRESEFISVSGAIMEPLCLVKSHEITQVTASVYSTVEKDSLVGVGVSSLKLGLVSVATIQHITGLGIETDSTPGDH